MANLKNTEIDATSSLQLPIGTTSQRPGNPQPGMIRLNTDTESIESYDGSIWRQHDSAPAVISSGGEISYQAINGESYRLHVFKSSGTFTISSLGSNNLDAEVLIVAGGGGGAGGYAGDEAGSAGGAGEVIQSNVTLSQQSYSITVGNGGAGGDGGQSGSDGQNSSAFGITANGGFGAREGAEPGGSYGGPGNNGGSYGNDTGGGGGGAGEPGQDAGGGDRNPGPGGDGIDLSDSFGFLFGENGFFSGGGGGGHGGDDGSAQTTPIGGRGGGGRGGDGWDSIPAESGAPNTGGGGGGGQGTGDPTPKAGDGGSGIVLVRYRI